ncbi:MAG: putative quinol monooxygenase [Glutamicibacter arilaitensis]|uniref:putative quinol monooxygenase n=1 Tax=Glutamicibacter arilaitensis TaxID=256701 RepID=UPI003FD2E438
MARADGSEIYFRAIGFSLGNLSAARRDHGRLSSMGTVILEGKLLCTDAAEVELVKKLLPEHIRLTKAEPGCISFTVTQSQDPWVWLVNEEFADGAAFEAHQQRATASTWGRRTSGLQRSYEVTGV